MALVLDASVCGSWMLPGESDPLGVAVLVRLRKESAWVPFLWWYEVRNLLLINERRKRIGIAESESLTIDLQGFDVDLDTSPDSAVIMRLARKHGLTIYDTACLELAKRKVVPLATLDRRLAAAAEAEGVELVS